MSDAAAAPYPSTATASSSAAAPRRGLVGLGALFGALYFVQGIGDPSSGLIAQPVRSLLDRWGESPGAIASAMALLALPWSLKPLLALASDFLPIAGSRRRIYLLAATAVAAAGLAAVAVVPLPAGARAALLALLFLPTLGIAFTDVLADALMIETGKPRGLTGVLQSVQWFAAYAALLLSGTLGGWLTATSRYTAAFLLCAVLWAISLVLAALFVREPPAAATAASLQATGRALRGALRVPGLLSICGLSFLWDCDPLSQSVLYLHVHDTLGLSEQIYGNGYSLFALGGMLASGGYGLYCRRAPTRWLVHGCIVAGAVANVLYGSVTTASTLYVASLLSGAAYMTGSMILLDLAARLVPVPVAATVFATIMALANLGSVTGEAGGGWLFEWAAAHYGASSAFEIVVLASTGAVAFCWLALPRLKHEVPEWWRAARAS